MQSKLYKEELKIELGNAIAAYGQVLRKASLGISSQGFEHLLTCSNLELTYKMAMDIHMIFVDFATISNLTVRYLQRRKNMICNPGTDVFNSLPYTI